MIFCTDILPAQPWSSGTSEVGYRWMWVGLSCAPVRTRAVQTKHVAAALTKSCTPESNLRQSVAWNPWMCHYCRLSDCVQVSHTYLPAAQYASINTGWLVGSSWRIDLRSICRDSQMRIPESCRKNDTTTAGSYNRRKAMPQLVNTTICQQKKRKAISFSCRLRQHCHGNHMLLSRRQLRR